MGWVPTLLVVDAGVGVDLVGLMLCVDQPHGSRPGAHDEGLRAGAPGVVVHTAEEVAVGDARGREKAVFAPGQAVDTQNFVEVPAPGRCFVALLLVPGPELALHAAAHALEGRCGDDPLGGAADAEKYIDTRVGPGGRNGTGDISVGNEANTSSCLTDLGDQVFVAVAVEDYGSDVSNVLALPFGDGLEVLGR